jgi:hypothetical protein
MASVALFDPQHFYAWLALLLAIDIVYLISRIILASRIGYYYPSDSILPHFSPHEDVLVSLDKAMVGRRGLGAASVAIAMLLALTES